MNKKLFMLWSFLLCFALGISAEDVTLQTNSSTFAVDAAGNYVATSGDLTFTYSQAASSTPASQGVVDAHLRIYKNATLTVSSTRNIKKIVLTSTGSSYKASGFTTKVGTYTTKD